jgi:hypothetical protein
MTNPGCVAREPEPQPAEFRSPLLLSRRRAVLCSREWQTAETPEPEKRLKDMPEGEES